MISAKSPETKNCMPNNTKNKDAIGNVLPAIGIPKNRRSTKKNPERKAPVPPIKIPSPPNKCSEIGRASCRERV